MSEWQAASNYTAEEFMRGTPEEIFGASRDPSIFMIWPHGDETLGPLTAHRIASGYPELHPHVDYMCGNPRAAAAAPPVRHTEGPSEGFAADGTDMNRDYTPGITPVSYEQHRATYARKTMEYGSRGEGYTYILDAHTSLSAVGRCMLISEKYQHSRAVRAIIACSPITRIVVLPDAIARDGLIGNYDNAVSLEYERPMVERGVTDTLITIRGLVRGVPLVAARSREFYHVTGGIPKGNEPPRNAPNFVWYGEGGYFPVLFGENSYRKDPTKPYVGFAATRREIVTL